jgi:hypothetical protein
MDGSRLLTVLVLAASISTGASRVQAPVDGARALAAPVLWVLGTLGVPVEAPAPLPNSQALERDRVARTLVFPVGDDGLAVYLEVAGRVEFESAEVHLAGGASRRVALAGAVRGRGLYQLCDLGGMARVESVTLRASGRGEDSRVGVRLGR